MKGAVFTILQEMVETQMGFEMWDALIEECDLPSGGIYTSAASYDDEEIFALVGKMVDKTGVPADQLLESFGQYLFGKLHASLPITMNLPDNFFDYMEKVHSVIHVEVKKLDQLGRNTRGYGGVSKRSSNGGFGTSLQKNFVI